MASETVPFPAGFQQPSRAFSSRAQAIRNHLPGGSRSCSIRRRPASVFSRRGTDTPIQPIEPVNMWFASPSPSNPPKGPAKRWKIGRPQSMAPDQKGTVLCAVPQSTYPSFGAMTNTMAPGSGTPSPVQQRSLPELTSHAAVETAMATLPNNEILYNINRSTPSLVEPPLRQANQSTPRTFSFPMSSPISPKKSRKSAMNSEGDATVIGVWKDGRAHWEGEPVIPFVQHPHEAFAELDSTPLRLETPVREIASAQKDQRPKIQVIIPRNRQHGPTKPRLPVEPPPIPPASVAEIMSSSTISPPSVTNKTRVRNSIVSPLASQTARPRRQVAQATVPVYLEQLIKQPQKATPQTMHKTRPSISSSSNGSTETDDGYGSSNYSNSNRTSMSSIDDTAEGSLRPRPNLLKFDGQTASKAYSIMSPAAAGIFDDYTPVVTASNPASPVDNDAIPELNKPLSAEAEDIPSSVQAPPTPAQLRSRASTPALPTLSRTTTLHRGNSRRNPRIPLSVCSTTPAADTSRTVPHVTPPSPTLSEAENALEVHLSSIAEHPPLEWDDVVSARRTTPSQNLFDSVSAPSPPPLPPKSNRRNRVSLPVTGSPHLLPGRSVAQQVRPRSIRVSSSPFSALGARNPQRSRQHLNIIIPNANQTKYATTSLSSPDASTRHIPSKTAEAVIRGILEHAHSLEDLFATAMVNQGFYRIYRRNKLSLLRTVLRNQSAPAWEHRETCPPYDCNVIDPDSARPQPDYTPKTYYGHYRRDAQVIKTLKSLVLSRCQSFLRPETVVALASDNDARSARMDDAFWRIWTFCQIFGCGKGREDDIVGQMDWLRGGPLVHQAACRATIMSSDSIDDSNTLLNAPEHFAMGNSGGLSAEQLYDMTEIWTCMSVLISGLEGRTDHARQYGVFDATDVRGGDIDGEELMLQEWMHYIMTLGLPAILELAGPSTVSKDPSAFVIAAQNGWIHWAPPQLEGSRSHFLKEAVARVYEEKIAALASPNGASKKQEMREISRQRIAAHRAEIRLRKRSGDCHTVRMSMERPISEWEGVLNALNARVHFSPPQSQAQMQAAGVPEFQDLPAVMEMPDLPELPGSDAETDLQEFDRRLRSPTLRESKQTQLFDAPTELHPALRHDSVVHPAFRGVDEQHLPPAPARASPSGHASVSSISARTSFERGARSENSSGRPSSKTTSLRTLDMAERHRQPASLLQHPRQQELLISDPADNTAEKAIFRIVEMGFTPEDAKYALMMTDLGDGLRVDRAVELLLTK